MREAAHLGERPRPVRQAGTVAEVDEVLVRERDEALVQHRQAADARVEHADRPLVHARDCREADGSATVPACCGASSSPAWPRWPSAAPASAFSKEDGVETMDDGVALALTRYRPDGARRPAAGPA